MPVNNIIRLKENDDIASMFQTLQSTKFRAMDKTEILKSLLAQAVYQIEMESNQYGFVRYNSKAREKAKKSLDKFRESAIEKAKVWFIENGYDPDKMTDEEVYNVIDKM
jgi:hypothetical protein